MADLEGRCATGAALQSATPTILPAAAATHMTSTRARRLPVGITSVVAVAVVALNAIPPTGVGSWVTIALGAALVATDVIRYRQGDPLLWQVR
ncbi:hypothetical protein [Pseudonocardia sp.]|uniref:hypothetical protein n=1 Tax=Pseudonocardia sp. TaxID=60912 RepID=UPI003D0BAAC4